MLRVPSRNARIYFPSGMPSTPQEWAKERQQNDLSLSVLWGADAATTRQRYNDHLRAGFGPKEVAFGIRSNYTKMGYDRATNRSNGDYLADDDKLHPWFPIVTIGGEQVIDPKMDPYEYVAKVAYYMMVDNAIEYPIFLDEYWYGQIPANVPNCRTMMLKLAKTLKSMGCPAVYCNLSSAGSPEDIVAGAIEANLDGFLLQRIPYYAKPTSIAQANETNGARDKFIRVMNLLAQAAPSMVAVFETEFYGAPSVAQINAEFAWLPNVSSNVNHKRCWRYHESGAEFAPPKRVGTVKPALGSIIVTDDGPIIGVPKE